MDCNGIMWVCMGLLAWVGNWWINEGLFQVNRILISVSEWAFLGQFRSWEELLDGLTLVTFNKCIQWASRCWSIGVFSGSIGASKNLFITEYMGRGLFLVIRSLDVVSVGTSGGSVVLWVSRGIT